MIYGKLDQRDKEMPKITGEKSEDLFSPSGFWRRAANSETNKIRRGERQVVSLDLGNGKAPMCFTLHSEHLVAVERDGCGGR